MAVTIDEMHVEVQHPPPQTSAPAQNPEPKKETNVSESLQILHERKLRLRAD
jgi:hypothetical protein